MPFRQCEPNVRVVPRHAYRRNKMSDHSMSCVFITDVYSNPGTKPLKKSFLFFRLHQIVDQKAATVPHTAIPIEEVRITTSTIFIFSSKDIFATIGPITHSTNTEKDPRIAMIVPKSGTSIDTVTARQTRPIRSKMINTRLSERLNFRDWDIGDFGSVSRSSFRV